MEYKRSFAISAITTLVLLGSSHAFEVIYTSSNLEGHSIAESECNPDGGTDCACSDEDGALFSEQTHGGIVSNVRGQNTWINTIGHKKFRETLPDGMPIRLGIYRYRGAFRLPVLPAPDDTQRENPQAVHMMIQLWDGRNELFASDKTTLEGTIYWDLNPWLEDGQKGKIKVYTNPINLDTTGIEIAPDTTWHNFELVVDLERREYVSITVDDTSRDLRGFELARVRHADWGDEISLAITTESLAAWPQANCSSIYTWTTLFKDLEFSLQGEDETQDTSSDWPNRCGDARIDMVIDDFEDPALWSYCCGHDDLPEVEPPSRATGCSGASLAFDYDLKGGDWFVFRRAFESPVDLGDATHLRLAWRGDRLDAHHNLQIKLANTVDAVDNIYGVVAESAIDLPTWRVGYVDLREFRCFDDSTKCKSQPPLDPSAITQVQIAVARCRREDGTECEAGSDSSVVYLDELAAVDLHPGAEKRLVQTQFEQVVPDPALRAASARAILEQRDDRGLVPAWFDEVGEKGPNYNTYGLALSLLVFIDEYEQSDDSSYEAAAKELASRLLSLQIPEGKINAGAWYTAYKFNENKVVPFDASCGGDETETEDIDRCSWIGNTAWAAIALDRLRASGIYDDQAELYASLARAASWMMRQTTRIDAYPGLVTLGMEGNISTYFALLASGKFTEARQLGDAIFNFGWDAEQERMKMGAGPFDYGTAMDTAGSWGVRFLHSIGKKAEALASQAYAATVLRTTSFGADNPASTLVEGYGDIAGPWTVTVEFGAQGAAAGILDANHIVQQINLLQSPNADGSFPGSADDWFGGTVAPWNTTMIGVPPTAWVYFAHSGDPLAKLYPTGDFDGDGDVDFQDFFILLDGFGKKLDEEGFNGLVDLDRSGQVGFEDLFVFIEHLGERKL